MDGTDRLFNAAHHLISPPPEETLRRQARAPAASPQRSASPPAAKRKRAVPATTPNPRLRKQQRENSADDGPPPSPTPTVRARRSRSATPIPHYEPPTDVFTPPREVFVSPATRVSKSSKRKSVKKKKRSPPPLVVKLEMPDIDLTAPMPPPSPGDDPLLLTGPSSSPTRSRSEADLFDIQKDVAPAPPLRRTISPAPTAFLKKLRFDDLPPSSPPQDIASSPNLDDPMPLFDWSDSDTDELPILSEPVSEPQDGEGDYTGRWQDVFVKTKADPPPSTSKEHKWPFPLSLEKAPPFALAHREDNDDQTTAEPDPFDFSSITDDEPLPSTRQLSPELGQPEPEEQLVSSPVVEPAPVEQHLDTEERVSEHASDEERHSSEERVSDHASDEERSSEESVSEHASDEELPLPESPCEDHQRQSGSPSVDAEEDDNSSGDDEPDIVKITSADPRAAARAAAILKQHNYDCFTRKQLKKKYSDTMRRRSSGPFELARAVFEGGVRKRRKTIGGMGVRGENVFIPGSPATTLPNLLREIEAEVSIEQSPFQLRSSPPNPFKTPLPNRNSPFLFSGLGLTPKVPMTPGETCYDPLTGERMWTKEEWKRLDACFTDERLLVGATLGLMDDDGLASVDLVDLENVLARFVEWMGGEEAVAEYGPDWSREQLMQRTRALRKKQRTGKVAPPTTLPMSPASPWGTTMEVPEFTPIRPKPAAQRREWATETETPLRSRQEETRAKAVPPTLLAPRYSHLLEEAISISKELPQITLTNASQESDTVLGEPESDSSRSTLVEDSELVRDPSPTLAEIQPDTIGKRVKGILFSYLPTLKKSGTKTPKRVGQPGLPLPPQDVLTKPRGPVMTPAREPVPKVIPPKDLVHLQQAPPVQTPTSKIPKVVHPKELVELNHVTPKVADEHRTRERRRSSGAGSVKDLIKGFEDMESQNRVDKVEVRGEIRRMKSIGEWRKGLGGGADVKRPAWKF